MNIEEIKAVAILFNRIPRIEEFVAADNPIEHILLAADGQVEVVSFEGGAELVCLCSGIQHHDRDESCYVLRADGDVIAIFPNENGNL